MFQIVPKKGEILLCRKEIKIHPEPKGVEVIKTWHCTEELVMYLVRTKQRETSFERLMKRSLEEQKKKKQEAMLRRKEKEPRSYIVDFTESDNKITLKMYRNLAG